MDQPSIAPGQLLTLSLLSWGRLGEAMAQYDGRDIFVFGGIPGERVLARVLRVHRRYVAAQVKDVLEVSPWRVEPPCPYFGACTGCQWQHLDYQRQLVVKGEMVADALKRVGGFANPPVAPVVPSPSQYGYRNHARFTVGPEGHLGFVHRQTRRFVGIDHCLLMNQGINSTLAALQSKCRETSQLTVRAGADNLGTLVQPALSNPDVALPTGQKSYVDSIDGRRFRVSSPSFFQVNVEQTGKLVEVIRDGLGLKATDILLDAYAGVGTFASLLAPYVRRVVAVEESAAALSDARENTAGTDNIELVLGRVEERLSRLGEKPDVAVLDPPRAGCHPEALAKLIELAPPRVAYVSCDAETLARDLKLLCQQAYSLRQVIPLDMFPQTHHVECVALLSRNGPRDPVVLASASPRRRELLSDLGLEFEVAPADVPEAPLPGETASQLAQRLSLAKALAVAPRVARGYIIGADSVVVLHGEALGKPADAADARRMLRELRGTRHQVVTGITVLDAATGRRLTASVASDVALRNYSDWEIEASISSGTLMDKAGAYAVQDREFQPAQSWEGCYTNIVGLPLCRLVEMLEELGCRLPLAQERVVPPQCGPSCPLLPQVAP